MRKDADTPFVIFSAEKADKMDVENRANTKLCVVMLQGLGIKHKTVQGRSDGNVETSFLINAKYESDAAELAKKFGQLFYLTVDAYKVAAAVNVGTGEKQVLGEFVRAVGEPVGDYTLDLEANQYWEVR